MLLLNSKNIDTIKVGDIFKIVCPITQNVYVMKLKRCSCGCGKYVMCTRSVDEEDTHLVVYVGPTTGDPIKSLDVLIEAIKDNEYKIAIYTNSALNIDW